jgi:hypothetical protein
VLKVENIVLKVEILVLKKLSQKSRIIFLPFLVTHHVHTMRVIDVEVQPLRSEMIELSSNEAYLNSICTFLLWLYYYNHNNEQEVEKTENLPTELRVQ